MTIPEFFQDSPRIIVADPLCEFLGGACDGVLEYTYLDVVKLAGHSCPTVAASYLMARKALADLYPRELPRRGEIKVEMRDGVEDGVTGVIASVLGMITGAAGAGGFRGIAGKFARRNLLSFNAPITGEVRFTRVDTGASVEATVHPEAAMPSSDLRAKLGQALQPGASKQQLASFGQTWQARVRELMVDQAENPNTIELIH